MIDAKKHYGERMAAFAAETVTPGGVVLFGSSHLEWFDTAKLLPEFRFVNRGIASDRLDVEGRGLLHRLDISVFDCQPAFIVLQNGINDLGELARTGTPPLGDIFTWYEQLVARIRERLPEVPLSLVNEMPTTGRFAVCLPYVPAFNAHICDVAARHACLHMDIHQDLVDGTGELRSELTYDGLHLNDTGYQILADRLRGVLPTA